MTALVVMGCQRSSDGAVFPEVVGTWQWVWSEGGYMGDTIVPGLRNRELPDELIIQLHRDGSYRELIDGRMGYVGTVDTAHSSRFADSTSLPALSGDTLWWFADFADTVLVERRADTLIVTPANWTHGYMHYFVLVDPSRFQPRDRRPER